MSTETNQADGEPALQLYPGDAGWTLVSRRLVTLRRLVALPLVLAGTALATALAALLAGRGAAAGVLLAGLAAAWAVVPLTARQWRAWGYAERADDLLIRRGVLIRRLSVVPYGRMQFVDVVAGPLDRRFGLATVHLHTAAATSDARIPGLAAEEATRLRDRLAALGEARAAGL